MTGAVIVAAGRSARMGGIDKLIAELGGLPVLRRTLLAVAAAPEVEEIVLVVRPGREEELAAAAGPCLKLRAVVPGGETRQQSVLAGVQALSPGCELVAIHDGARPLVSQRVLEEVLAAAAVCSAAAPATPVKDTIKAAHNGVIESTPDRSTLFAVQTPQVFDADLIRTALTRAVEEGAELTDDCGAVERLGIPVRLTAGEYINLKITTPEDAAVAEALLDWRDSR